MTGEIDLLKKFQWYEKTNGIIAKKIVLLFEIDCIEPLKIKELLLEAYPFLKEEELLLNDFLENMVITAVHEKNDVFLKKYITHLPVRPEEESKQSLKIISYLYQLEYQPYDAYLKENASVTQKIQEINLFDSALLTEKAKSLLNLVESYQQAKKNTIYVYVNPVTMQAEEGIFEGSCNLKKAVFDLSQYSLKTPYEEIASEFLKEHSVTPFELQKVNDTLCEIRPISAMVGSIGNYVAERYRTRQKRKQYVQFGYTPERRTINGKTGSVLVPSENAEAVRVSYDLYQHSKNSLTDVIRYLTENGINASRPTPRTKTGISNLDRSHLSRILENSLYVRADKDVYRYFLSKGYEMLDDIEAYDGVHCLFVYAGDDDTYFVKVAYHEWLVDGDVWLRVQDRKAHQNKFPNNGKAMNSWLVGMVKCACCGYAMHFNHCANRKGVVYYRFIDYGKFTLNGCPTPPIQIKLKQVEETVLKEMRKRIEQLHIEKHEASPMPKRRLSRRRSFALTARYRSPWKSSPMPTAFSLTTFRSV